MGIFENYTPLTRSRLFMVCITFRILLVILTWMYYEEKYVKEIVIAFLLASLIGIVNGMMKEKREWWKREFHLAIVVLSLYAIYKDDKQFLVSLLATDVVFGVKSAILAKPFM